MLTNGGWFGILTKLSARWRLRQRVGRKNHLTAATRCGNLNRLPQMTGKRKFRTSRKKFLTKLPECGKLKKLLLIQNGSGAKNFWKKFLTNEMKWCTIAMFRRKRRVPCKLNNVTKRKHQTERFLVSNHEGAAKKLQDRVKSITGACNYKNEAMTNSSVKD